MSGPVLLPALQRPDLALLVSAVFGLSQGGIVPSYALIVREYFPAGGRHPGQPRADGDCPWHGLGGWMSGVIYDLTGSYRAAFLNGIGWNLLNMTIALWLLTSRWRPTPSLRPAA